MPKNHIWKQKKAEKPQKNGNIRDKADTNSAGIAIDIFIIHQGESKRDRQ